MIIALTHFESDEFIPLLKLWYEQYLRAGCTLPVIVLADRKVRIPQEFVPYDPAKRNRFSFARFDPISEVVRPGRAFDVKGSLILSSLELLADEQIFLVDSDAFLQRDPARNLVDLRGAFCMGEDPMVRHIRGIPEEIKERNAGVLFFGTTNPAHRARIRSVFIENFRSLMQANDGPLLEQIAWTKTYHDLQKEGLAQELPRVLNWSYLWGREDVRTVVLHEHGPQKWRRVPGANPDSPAYKLFK